MAHVWVKGADGTDATSSGAFNPPAITSCVHSVVYTTALWTFWNTWSRSRSYQVCQDVEWVRLEFERSTCCSVAGISGLWVPRFARRSQFARPATGECTTAGPGTVGRRSGGVPGTWRQEKNGDIKNCKTNSKNCFDFGKRSVSQPKVHF